MDRDRLKEVHQTDLTESRVNEEFVDWLKSKGLTWLLVVLVAICAYLAVVRFKQGRVNRRAEAWSELFQAELPGSFEDVARDYGDVDQLGNYARVRAAEQLLRSVQRGTTLGAPETPTTPGAPPEPTPVLSAAEREQYLARADRLYDEIIATDTNQLDLTLFIVGAINGKAAVAECRGDAAAARALYQQAAERAAAFYPGLADQALRRLDSVDDSVGAVTFRTRQEVDAARAVRPPATPVEINEALEDLVLPDETGG